jgi:hypothetical protein
MRRNIRILAALVLLPVFSFAAQPPQADKIVVIKSSRTMTLFRAGQVLKSYKVA